LVIQRKRNKNGFFGVIQRKRKRNKNNSFLVIQRERKRKEDKSKKRMKYIRSSFF
jgi:hypothetical protein